MEQNSTKVLLQTSPQGFDKYYYSCQLSKFVPIDKFGKSIYNGDMKNFLLSLSGLQLSHWYTRSFFSTRKSDAKFFPFCEIEGRFLFACTGYLQGELFQ